MKLTLLLAIFCGILAGALQGLQPAVNAALARHVSHPLQASFISFATGLALILVVCFCLGAFPPKFKAPPADVPWWAWTGGSIGAVMVTSSLMLAPSTGATMWFALIVTGQVISTMLLDHFGWAGFAVHPINVMRLIGTTLLILGVLIVIKW